MCHERCWAATVLSNGEIYGGEAEIGQRGLRNDDIGGLSREGFDE
jgi:hypothetical protein